MGVLSVIVTSPRAPFQVTFEPRWSLVFSWGQMPSGLSCSVPGRSDWPVPLCVCVHVDMHVCLWTPSGQRTRVSTAPDVRGTRLSPPCAAAAKLGGGVPVRRPPRSPAEQREPAPRRSEAKRSSDGSRTVCREQHTEGRGLRRAAPLKNDKK